MSLYFDSPVQLGERGAVTTTCRWHRVAALLAAASYSQERGGFVTVFDELGEAVRGVEFPSHAVSQVTALAWHPERPLLATGWETGELKCWTSPDKEFRTASGPRGAPVTALAFSDKGGRLVSADASGALVGWKVDGKGALMTVFHHELKEPITHLTFRLSTRPEMDVDIGGLARAAVNGDEAALDMFSDWRPKTTARQFRFSEGHDEHAFFAAVQNGLLYHVTSTGNCTRVLSTEGGAPFGHVLQHPSRDELVVVTEGLNVAHYRLEEAGGLAEVARVKLSARAGRGGAAPGQALAWLGEGALAILVGELAVRVWDLDTSDNYVLPTVLKTFTSEERSRQASEAFTCIASSPGHAVVAAGTGSGQVYFWTRRQGDDESSATTSWVLSNVSSLDGNVKQLTWGSVQARAPLLAVNCVTRLYVLREQSLSTACSRDAWVVQKNATQVSMETAKSQLVLRTEVQVTGMALNREYLAVTNNRVVAIYHAGGAPALLNSFRCDNDKIALRGKDVVVLTQHHVTLRSPAGAPLAVIGQVAAEGEFIGMDLHQDKMALFTMHGYLRVYDVSGREPRIAAPVKNMYEACPDFGEIIEAKCNCDGTKVALTIVGANMVPDGRLYVWDVDNDHVASYDFRLRRGSQHHHHPNHTSSMMMVRKRRKKSLLAAGEGNDAEEAEGDGNEEEVGATDAADADDDDDVATAMTGKERVTANRVPVAFYWDTDDPRLLVCQAKRYKGADEAGQKARKPSGKGPADLRDCDNILVTMFVSAEHGPKIQDVRPLEPSAKLLGLYSPHISILDKMSVERLVMSDFEGLEECDKATRDAVLDFSYHLSLGNMDCAFRSIKLVQSPHVWASLARMCVKTRRLDVAGVCLGHMKNARAAAALRKASADDSLPEEAKLAVLAAQLGLNDEAEQLYISCGRYDLLNRFYRDCNRLEDALTTAETKDRIHVRNTEFAWASSLEQAGDLAGAAMRYERANTHRYNVPRMLVDHPKELASYMTKTNDGELLKWWGQFTESQGDMNAALKVYEQAGDVFSQVRVLCFLGQEEQAAELGRSTSDRAACYHMARHYETAGNVEAAVAFFTKAGAFSNAVRLCTEHSLTEELWNLGAVAGRRERLECARYFERRHSYEKAVMLYHRAGMLHKALDLVFEHNQYDALRQISADLDENSDPALIKKCADFFVAQEMNDVAVELLARTGRYAEAVEICAEKRVHISEVLAEQLTPERDSVGDLQRIGLLEKLAECLLDQGDYHLATKKFTQAGNKIRAMKALLKSGDTEKIVFFAGVSRQREIYIMAANYLQSLDWQNQPEVLKNIITFYSKGRAMDLLANFYIACAQVEIDEFQNYEKAQGALTEASRCLSKVIGPKDLVAHRRVTDTVQSRIDLVKRFLEIKRLFLRNDVTGGMAAARRFLLTGGPDMEQAVRRGDVYALMIQNGVRTEDFEQARDLLNELKHLLYKNAGSGSGGGGGASVTYYVGRDVLEVLAAGLRVPLEDLVPQQQQQYTYDQQEDADLELGDVNEEVD